MAYKLGEGLLLPLIFKNIKVNELIFIYYVKQTSVVSNKQKEDELGENIKRQEIKDNLNFGGFAAGRRKFDEKSGSLSF